MHLDLTKGEVVSIRLWAESSLTSSAKNERSTFGNSCPYQYSWGIDWIRNLITSPITMVTKNNYQSVLGWILITLLLFIATFSKTMIEIFKNIAIQSLIVETCLVAEYAVEELEVTQSAKESHNRLQGLFNAIVHKISKLL